MPLVILKTLLSWAWNNRKGIALGLIFLALYNGGIYRGSAKVQAEWDAAKIEQQKELNEARAKIEETAHNKSAEYQAEAAAAREETAKTKRSLKNALIKNAMLRGCVVDDDFMQIYEHAAGHPDH